MEDVMAKTQCRQGDVLVTRIGAIPKGAKPMARDNGRIVLAYGEVTGHAHAIVEAEASLFGLLQDNADELYLDVDGEVHLRHEEHGTIAIAPGKYRVTRQREYTPSEIRNVAD